MPSREARAAGGPRWLPSPDGLEGTSLNRPVRMHPRESGHAWRPLRALGRRRGAGLPGGDRKTPIAVEAARPCTIRSGTDTAAPSGHPGPPRAAGRPRRSVCRGGTAAMAGRRGAQRRRRERPGRTPRGVGGAPDKGSAVVTPFQPGALHRRGGWASGRGARWAPRGSEGSRKAGTEEGFPQPGAALD